MVHEEKGVMEKNQKKKKKKKEKEREN